MSDETHQTASGPGHPPGLGALEREVMDVVWNASEITVRAVMDTLNAASDRERAYTTVMTVMSNLRRKGLLASRRERRADVYFSTMSRAHYFDARARSDIEALISQYGDIALAHFARETGGLDERRREQLRKLIADE